MKNIKKFLCVILAAVIILTCLPMTVFADDKVSKEDTSPNVEISTKTVGPELKVEISCLNMKDIGSGTISLSFDDEYLEYVSSDSTSDEKAMTARSISVESGLKLNKTNAVGIGLMALESFNFNKFSPITVIFRTIKVGKTSINYSADFWDTNDKHFPVSTKSSSIEIYSSKYDYHKMTDGTLEITGYEGIEKDLTIPSEIDGYAVSSIAYGAFRGSDFITSIKISDGIKSLDTSAFAGCTSLTSVTIPNSVTEIGIPNVRTAEYNLLGSFEGCTSLTNVTIPDSVTLIGAHTFKDCTSLTNITIPDSVTKIGFGAFENSGYYNNNDNWSNGELYIGNCLIECNKYFSGDYEIKAGTTCIANEAFKDCKSLTSVTIPDSVTSIGDDTFYCCESLTSVTMENGVKQIGENAFLGCSSLESITIPASVKEIEESAFIACANISDVYYGGTEEQWNNIAIKDYNEDLTSATIHFIGSQHEHTWSDWTITTPATCIEKGVETRTCTVCGKTETREIATTDHNLKHVSVPSTCSVAGVEYDVCLNCDKTFNNSNLPLAAHTYGEWVLTTPATTLKAGTETRTCTVCGETEIREIPKIEMPKETKDETSGISVQYKDDSFNGEIKLNVEQKFDGESYQIINKEKENFKYELFDISITSNGEKVQPSEKVIVKMPVPEGYNTEKLAVYYVTNSGTLEKMNSYYDNGYVYFEASHFSDYVIVDESENQAPEYSKGDVNGDGKVNASDARLALRISANLETATETQLLAADVDESKKVTASDARTILRVSANLAKFESK